MRYLKPNLDYEWREALRYREFEKMGKKGWMDIASNNYTIISCLLYTSPSPRDRTRSRMPSSA